MSPSKLAAPDQIAQLLQWLSYSATNGWVPADQFEFVGSHRFALAQARDLMSVVGAYCWLHPAIQQRISTPLVYVATTSNRFEAQAIHRRVWSQGLVPFLLIVTPEEILLCEGFRYSRENWDKSVSTYRWSDLLSTQIARSDNNRSLDLGRLSAIRLRSSLFWRDYAIDVTGRVDQRLLEGLDGLSWNLINGVGVSKKLHYRAANGLIGKLLYIFFLADRGVIDQGWLDVRGHGKISLYDGGSTWSMQTLWKLLEDLDTIFNGSIFPLSTSDRAQIDHTHVNLARSVIKHGAAIVQGGPLQLALIDIDLGVLRIETLSAVYEQFLENVRAGERRRVGAYYTPPYLVDLLLDRLEDVRLLEDGTTVLDPAAGSGVFLVGAYRRILERARTAAPESMSLEAVRGLLTRNIFGVERNGDACNVAAFSLYLTMLDYVNPRDLTRVAMGKDPKKLFPGLINQNLFPRDFFSKSLASKIPKVACAIGNPPWQTLKKLESTSAITWLSDNPESHVGNEQAAELFVWKVLRQHLVANGILAMLIPAKSFVNPTSAKFRNALALDFSIVGAINLAHLRHKLFVQAKHACAGLLVQNRPPEPDEHCWVYSPLSVSQPIASRTEMPWTFVMDRSDVQIFHQDFFTTRPRAWLEALVLRPVDRQIHKFVEDQAHIGRISLLGKLCKSVGAMLKRGGNSVETGLSDKYLADDITHEPVSQTSQGMNLELFGLTTLSPKPNRLPTSQLQRVTTQYKNQFSGNIVLVPRNFRGVRYVDYPKGYTSSFMAVFFNKPGDKTTDQEKRFLQAIAKYLGSRIAMYFVATIGRRWLIDRRNLEPADLADLPIPVTSVDDDRIDQIIALHDDELENYLLDAIGIMGALRSTIKEFLDFRMYFQDGNVPDGALIVPTTQTLDHYSDVLRSCLDGLVGRSGAFNVKFKAKPKAGVGIVVAHFSDDRPDLLPTRLDQLCKQAAQKHDQEGTNSFADSLILDYQAETTSVVVTKPLEYFRWTVDCAYADSRQVLRAFTEATN